MPVRFSVVQCGGAFCRVCAERLDCRYQCVAVYCSVSWCVGVCVLSGANADAHAHASRALEYGANGREWGKGGRCAELGVGGQDIATS